LEEKAKGLCFKLKLQWIGRGPLRKHRDGSSSIYPARHIKKIPGQFPSETFGDLKKCEECLAGKRGAGKLPLQPIMPKSRTERVEFDFSYLPFADEEGNKYILLFINTFTKWIWATVTRSMDTKQVIKFIKKTFKKGQFWIWQCDNGSSLKNDEVRALIKELGGKMVNSAPYHPQTNGQVERPNGT